MSATHRGPVLALLLAAGVVGLLVSAQPWFRAVGDPGGGAADPVVFSGGDATGGLSQALASVVLAGVLLTLVLAVRGRRVVAVLLALAGLGMVVLGVLRSPPSEASVRIRLRQVSLAEVFSLESTAWPWSYAVAGLLAVLGAVLLWIGAPHWTRRTRRYERATPDAALGGLEERLDPADDPADAWRALDVGIDPTLDPDVRSAAAADTMGGGHVQEQARGHVNGQSQSKQRQDGEQ